MPGGHYSLSVEEATSMERPRPILLPCVTGISLSSSFYCFGGFVGVGGVCVVLACLYNIIKHLQVINLIPGSLLAQL